MGAGAILIRDRSKVERWPGGGQASTCWVSAVGRSASTSVSIIWLIRQSLVRFLRGAFGKMVSRSARAIGPGRRTFPFLETGLVLRLPKAASAPTCQSNSTPL